MILTKGVYTNIIYNTIYIPILNGNILKPNNHPILEQGSWIETRFKHWDYDPYLGQGSSIGTRFLNWDKIPELGQGSWIGTRFLNWKKVPALGQWSYLGQGS